MEIKPPEMPTLDEPPRRRWQFSLAWLFWLTTAVAAIATVVRVALDNHWLRLTLIGYAVVVGGFFVLRLHYGFYYWMEQRRILQYRRKLNEWANSLREAARHNKMSDEP